MKRHERWLWCGVLSFGLAWRLPAQAPRVAPDTALHGCWRLSREIFRGLPARSPAEGSHWSVVELTSVQIGRYASVRVLGAPTRVSTDTRAAYRLHAWRPIAPDSVLLSWSVPPNAMEVRLQVRGDSATGEFFYHGDIVAPGRTDADLRRPPVPVTAVRVRCPDPPAG